MNKFALIFYILFSLTSHSIEQPKTNAIDRIDREKIEYLKKQMNSNEQLEQTAKDFESIAITKMLQNMYEGVKVDPLFNSNSSEGIYKDLLLIEYGKIISENGGIGLADSILRDMEKMDGKHGQHSTKN